ncbi:MAG: bifunctional DNA-formamidopyrimidine glycosylase/DNA-(apurinic or apyrimidinic site) lyase [Candidatus Falkowbacteria bacterium]
MPELPEVETVRRDLDAAVTKKKIKVVEILSRTTIKNQPADFLRFLKDAKFIAVERIGKLLIFSLSDKKHWLLIHLKMTGQLIYQDGKKVLAGGHILGGKNGAFGGNLPGKATRFYLELADKSKLFFNDQRNFGYAKIVDADELEIIKAKYGIEPLQANFILKSFAAIFAGRNKNVKALLLDQNLIAGIGNIYADETLFAAGILPARIAKSLTPAEIKKLFAAIKTIIAKAIKNRGTTFSDYIDAHGHRGGFSKFLQVYGRAKEKCYKCGTILKKAKIAGRGTVFCEKCQK